MGEFLSCRDFSPKGETLLIRSIRPAEDSEWDELVQRDASTTFFHTRTWHTVVSKHFDLRLAPKLLLLESGQRVLLPLAIEKFAKGFGRKHISSPLGTYGGFVMEGTVSKHEQAALLQFLGSLGSLSLRDTPYNSILQGYDGIVIRDSTEVLDLEQPMERLVTTMNKQQIPRKVRQAEKHSLQLRRIGPERIEQYYEIYQDCQQRWGIATSHYSLELLTDLCRSEGCEYWGVFTPSEKLICAGPFLTAHRHVVSWLAVAKSESLSMKPYEFLYFHLIKHYKEQGFKWFDFNPSGGHEGVKTFKQGFGTQTLQANVLTQQGMLERLVKYGKKLLKA